MTKTLVLVWYFYRPLLPLNLIFSIIGIIDLYKVGASFIIYTFFIKIVGYAGCIFYKHFFANKTYLYFLNSGYSIKKMYSYTFSLDFTVYLVMVTLVYFIKWLS
jgi:hypothetical protein